MEEALEGHCKVVCVSFLTGSALRALSLLSTLLLGLQTRFLKHVYLAVLSLSCGMWDLSLSHWTTREIPKLVFFVFVFVFNKTVDRLASLKYGL